MRKTVIQFTGVIILGASFAVLGQPAHTNGGGLHRQPYWYQCVTNGVTLHYLTPVAYFRGLLGMTPTERQRVLADKPEQEQEQVLAKVREYQALPREVREERLRQTELHWYLLVLLRLDPVERNSRLKDISPLDQTHDPESTLANGTNCRPICAMPCGKRKLFAQLRRVADSFARGPRRMLSANCRRSSGALDAGIEIAGRRCPRAAGKSCAVRFRRFFLLTEGERKETVQTLSDTERRQMEQALQSYANLPPVQQRECLVSFSKFAAMSAEERNEFLQNAAKWEAMSAPRTANMAFAGQSAASHGHRVSTKSDTPPVPPGWVSPPRLRPPVLPPTTLEQHAQASR